jgi:hypothetical protein
MEDKPSFEQVRADVEAKQEGILWEKAHKNGVSVDAFLWKGDPHAKPVQRAGLVVFALFCLMVVVSIVSIHFQKKDEDDSVADLFVAFAFFLLSMRLLYNAVRRQKSVQVDQEDSEKQ